MTAFFALMRSDLLTYFRSGFAIFWTFAFPILMLAMLMLAFGDMGKVSASLFIDDQAQTEDSRKLVETIYQTAAQSRIELEQADAEDATFRLTIPSVFDPRQNPQISLAFGELSSPGDGATLLSLVNAAMANHMIAHGLNPAAAIDVQPGSGGKLGTMTYGGYLTVGMVAMTLLSTAIFGFGLVLIDMRWVGGFRLYQVLPVSRTAFLTAFLANRMLIMMVFTPVFLLLADAIYDTGMTASPIRWILVILLAGYATVCFSAVGLAMAARVQRTATATAVGNVAFMGLIWTSDLFLSVDRLPGWVAGFSGLFPLGGLAGLMRDLLFEPVVTGGLQTMGLLGLWGGVSFLIAAKFFIWTPQTQGKAQSIANSDAT